MMAKAKFKGTTFTQIVFFEDREIDTLEKCEKEKRYGERGHWQYFLHRVNRLKGASLGVNYYCVVSAVSFSNWYDKNPYKYVYLTELLGESVVVQQTQNYADCMGLMRQRQPEETHALFCAKSNQH